jgi:Mrp family chromosome partitioning ATPase
MSKILEALDNAQADARAGGVQNEAAPSGPAARPDGAPGAIRFSRVSMEEEMIALRQRLDALLPDQPTRAIAFIGSREGEGTSTVVEEFARHSATRFDQRVLLLKMDLHGPAEGVPGTGSGGAAADARLRTPGGGMLDIAPLPQVFLSASHATDSQGPAAVWARLRAAYDLILVDAQPATSSPQGLAVSRQVDGVVLVLAAEDTRWPVAGRVKQSLERSGGRVLGVVFNKRQYHIPRCIYQRL